MHTPEEQGETTAAPGATRGGSDARAEALALERSNALTEMLKLSAPTVLTMASYTIMQFCDALMVSRIDPPDPVNLTAQGNGGLWAFVPMSLYAGLAGVVNTFVAQHLGAGSPQRGAAYVWNAMWIGAAMWVAVLLPMAVFMPSLFAAMGHGEQLVALESTYAQILLVGGLLTFISRSMSQFFFGLHRPEVPLAAAVAGNVVNLVLNWLLIYGNWGFPQMGVAGAALATVIGTGVEAAVPLAVFLWPKFAAKYQTRAGWRPSWSHMRDIFRLGWPPALMFGNEMICWAVFMTHLAGGFGTHHAAAGFIVLRYMHLSFMPAVGFSFACTAAVGRCLGAGRPDLAVHRARIGLTLAMSYMAVCAVVFVVFRHELVGVFVAQQAALDPVMAAQADAVIAVGVKLMLVAAAFQVFDGLAITLVGVLRGAGDTVWPGIATIVLAWIFILGLGWSLATFAPGLESTGPWIGAAMYVIALGVALGYRFASGKWKQGRLVGEPEGAGLSS